MTFTWEHVLYRLYDAEGDLLYVGITNSITVRFKTHASDKPWWPEVEGCRVDFLPNREALKRAERDAIWHERPRHNVMGSMTPPTPEALRARKSASRPAALDIAEALVGTSRKRLPLRRRVTDDEWAWIHGLPPYGAAA